MTRLPIKIALVLVSNGAVAGEFTPPEGCETFLTVQARGCEVSNYYRCTADNPGDQWRTDFGINGKTYTAMIDAEARWVKSYSYAPDYVERVLEPDEPDPASFSSLLATGYDAMDFFQSDSRGRRSHYKGYDKIIGDTVIDGVPLKRTEFSFTEWDGEGNFVRSVKGNEFVHPELGRFFGGTYQVELWNGDSYPADGTPIDFIFPGEPGFGATVPLYQCNDMMSSLEFTPKEADHDQL